MEDLRGSVSSLRHKQKVRSDVEGAHQGRPDESNAVWPEAYRSELMVDRPHWSPVVSLRARFSSLRRSSSTFPGAETSLEGIERAARAADVREDVLGQQFGGRSRLASHWSSCGTDA
jgi:hypothetical protein